MKKIFIVILNYNGEKDTIDCLKSLIALNQEGIDLTTLVIDNYPDIPTKISESDYKKINLKVIFNNENLGFSGGNNVGIDYAMENGANYVLILNNDTVVDPKFLGNLLSFMEKQDGAGIVSPKIYFQKGFEFHKERYKENEKGKVIWYAGGKIDWNNVYGSHVGVDEVDKGQFDSPLETDFATGCCFLISREVLEKVKGFNEKYFLYYEDLDLSLRIKTEGYKVFYFPDSIIWHKNAGSSGSGSKLQDYYITRNRLFFGLNYAPARAKLALIRESIRIVLKGREWQKRGVIDEFIGKMGKGSFKV